MGRRLESKSKERWYLKFSYGNRVLLKFSDDAIRRKKDTCHFVKIYVGPNIIRSLKL